MKKIDYGLRTGSEKPEINVWYIDRCTNASKKSEIAKHSGRGEAFLLAES